MSNNVQYYPVEKEYEKCKELKKENVVLLKEWLEKQPHLPKLTELEIILFLHSCYFNNELAKITIDNYFTSRNLCPEFFAERDPRTKTFQYVNNGLFTILDKRTNNGDRIAYVKIINCDPNAFVLSQLFKGFDMTVMLALRTSGTASGLIIVFDMEGIVLGHIAKLGLVTLKKLFYYLQECLPVRLNGLHFMNSPSFMDKVMALLKPFIYKELLSVLYVHTDNLTNLYPHVQKECLPKHLGGNSPTVEELYERQKKLFLDNVAYYLDDETKLADESKRPGKPKSANDVFGVEGTFKKLDID